MSSIDSVHGGTPQFLGGPNPALLSSSLPVTFRFPPLSCPLAFSSFPTEVGPQLGDVWGAVPSTARVVAETQRKANYQIKSNLNFRCI